MRVRQAWLGFALALVLIFVLAVIVAPVLEMTAQAEGDPLPGTVASSKTVTLYPSTLITDTTVYSTLNTETLYWNAADIFVYGDVVSTGVFTVTAQGSADGTYWADLDFTVGTTSTLYTHSYYRTISADGTDYMRVPLAGQYLRVMIWATGSATPLVKATLKNN